MTDHCAGSSMNHGCCTFDVCMFMAGMALDTQDVADYARSHAKGLRLTFWLFKTDQVRPSNQRVDVPPSVATQVVALNPQQLLKRCDMVSSDPRGLSAKRSNTTLQSEHHV